jgi:hypothetical protein
LLELPAASSGEYSTAALQLNVEGTYSASGEVIKGRPIFFAPNLGTDKRGTYLYYWQTAFKWVISSQQPTPGTFAEEAEFVKKHSLLTMADLTFSPTKIRVDTAWRLSDAALASVGEECEDNDAKFVALHATDELVGKIQDCKDAVSWYPAKYSD